MREEVEVEKRVGVGEELGRGWGVRVGAGEDDRENGSV